MIYLLYSSIVLMFVALINLVLVKNSSSKTKSFFLIFLSLWHLGYFVLSTYQRYEFFILVLMCALALLYELNEKEGA